VSFGMMVSGKNHLVEGNDIEQLVWGEGVGDCDYVRFFGEGHIFRRNYLHGTKKEEVEPAHVDGWQTYAVNPGEYAKDILIDGNILTGFFHQGVLVEGKHGWEGREFSAEEIVVRNNVFDGGRSAVLVIGARNIHVINNTLLNVVGAGFGMEFKTSLGRTPSTGTIKNNVFWHTPIYEAFSRFPDRPSSVDAAKNVIFDVKTQHSSVYWPRDILNKDPMLVDPTNILGIDGKPFTADDGYLLKPGSLCIDAGVRIDVDSMTDILGTLRPQGSGWDIGVHEFRN